MPNMLKTGMLLIIALSLMLFVLNVRKPDIQYHDQVAVIMYHHIYDQAISSSTITAKLFRDQLTLLQTKGYHFITLQQMKRFLSGAPVPENAVLVTFDDGYESFYSNAYPILKEMNIPAVNFIITGSLEHPQQDVPPKMSNEQIKAILQDSSLIEMQCHTNSLHNKNANGKALIVGHLALDGSAETPAAYKKRILTDTQNCISKLKTLNPKADIDALAYPFGIYSNEAAAYIQQAGIHYAFTIITKMATREVDHLRIPRINAGSPDVSPEDLVQSIQRSVVPVRR